MRASAASASEVRALVKPGPYVVVAAAIPPPARWKASAATTAPASCRIAVNRAGVRDRASMTWALPFPMTPNTSEARAAIPRATAAETVGGDDEARMVLRCERTDGVRMCLSRPFSERRRRAV
jgi:hypothetical protein